MDTTVFSAMNSVSAPLGVLGGNDRDFSKVLEALRAELAPNGLVEALMVDRVLLAVSRLRALVAGGNGLEGMAEELSQAEQSIDRALDALITAKSARVEGWGHPAPSSSRIGDTSSMSPLPSNNDQLVSFEEDRPIAVSTDTDELPWRDRLIFDEQVSEESPVVRGTWITAGQVVSMIVDGWSWDDILKNYPELTEADLRACLAFTVEQDGPIAF
ncbi:DUF433 domain-containing protein [Tautonia rosea]|uniref:DUF433 domain-containing protein n=1 Tax=Tautonia rosea TaxID=2728037 RepID=UPI0019CF5520|nr:DUF433 domain-containing protein [Tautonia rosea]